MEREHWHWKPNLEAEARAGNRRALAIVAEGKHPGKYFDGLTHMLDVVGIMRLEKENGATHVGIFGSRIQRGFLGRRVHRPLDSDVDILVINEKEDKHGEVVHEGTAHGINVVRISKNHWDWAEKNVTNNEPMRQIMMSVKWIWVKQGYSELVKVSELVTWAKPLF